MQNFRHILLVLLAVLWLGVAAPASAQNTVATDKAALVALYTATDGANWTTNTNWTSNAPLSSWHGVTTNSAGRVTALALNGNGLDGTLPTALGALDQLESLVLTSNVDLTGPLPAGLRELSALATVEIADTELCAPGEAAFQIWLTMISFTGLTCPPVEQSVIDVAVFYTPAARDKAGGTAAIQIEIDLMAAETNQAYQASGVNQRVALVAVEEVTYTEVDHETDLPRLHSRSDGHMDEVHTTRDRVAADIMILIASGGGGRAFRILTPASASADDAFGLVGLSGGSLTFAHELGHLMGLAHDRWVACGDGDCDAAATGYGYGYVNQRAFDEDAPVSAQWRTIMAYNNQCVFSANIGFRCQQVPRFSNPDQTYSDPGGDPLGVAGREPSTAVDGPADAVRTLNRTRATVANFRNVPAVTVSFGATTYTATEGGAAATVTVALSVAPDRPVAVPLVLTGATGATAYDYTAPQSVTFTATATTQTFTVTAVDDSADDDGETVTLTFDTGMLPSGMTVGSPATATVTLTDDDTETGVPSVLMVELTSDPGPDALYALGDEIEATVRFNKSVTVTGTPQLGLTVGSETHQMMHQGGGGEVLTFVYTVAEDDSDSDGVSIAADSLSGTIQDSTNRAADLDHAAVAAEAGHQVSGIRPVLQQAVVDGEILRLTYDKALRPTSSAIGATIVARGAFTVRSASAGARVRSVRVRGLEVHLFLSLSVTHGQTVTVSYTPGAWAIRDVAGSAAAAFSNQSARNATAEPVYDTDRDGLIGVRTLAQLAVLRHDLTGNGNPTSAGAAAYRAAFPDAFPTPDARLRCVGACIGYELLADLDFFDTNGDGQVDTNDDTNGDGQVDAEDTPYWNDGAGWQPIGTESQDPNVHIVGARMQMLFEGNGYRIKNLFINRPATRGVGLFGATDIGATIRHVGVVNVEVTGDEKVGGLVGYNVYGDITTSYATGRVSGGTQVGGLVGENIGGDITTSYATGRVSGGTQVGGLVGRNPSILRIGPPDPSRPSGDITTSYATGRVAGGTQVGGLVGENGQPVTASYATGRVTGESSVGGLLGGNNPFTAIRSYWDTDTSGQATGTQGVYAGEGQTTTALQVPTGSTGIYADWTSPWDFGRADEYPVLAVDFNRDGDATWQEFGYQLREGPSLTVSDTGGQVTLSWTAVDTDHWNPAPAVTYSVYRATGSTVEAVAEDLTDTEYTDTAATRGTDDTYQVTAVVNGGEATRSGLVTPNQSPLFHEGTSATRSVAENTPTGRAIGAPVSATDGDNDRLTYSLSGTDADAFSINSRSGQLRTKALLDHETQESPRVTVTVSDGKLTADIAVTINVTDASGRVTLLPAQPRVGNALTATVTDPDSPVSVSKWRWEWSEDVVTWNPITEATTATYVPGEADLGHYLLATATYTDSDGTPGKEARQISGWVRPPSPQSGGSPPGDGSGGPPGGGSSGGGGGAPACTQDDRHGNTATQATALTLNQATAGAICPAADVDYLTVPAPGRGLVFVDTTSGVSTRGTILQNGAVLASGTIGGSRQDARLGAFVQTGTVVVAIQGQGGATGAYAVEVTFTPGYLENPGADAFQSGVGVLSGWVCAANRVEIAIDELPLHVASYGTERLDTAGVCGDADNGFGFLFNWNRLGEGDHTVVALVDGVELGRATVTVTTLGEEFLRDVTGTCEVEDFPTLGESVMLVWQQNSQNFVIAGGSPPGEAPTGRTSALTGFLENPGYNSFQSGVRVISGWVCDAERVEIAIGHLTPQVAAYGTERLDTARACGDTDNGFGLLFNWNLLGDGEHEVSAYVDGAELGRATVRVTTLEHEFLRGVEGECVVDDFPHVGQSVLLEWQQNSQNFVITEVE